MNVITVILNSLSKKERILLVALSVLFILLSLTRTVIAIQTNSEFVPVQGGEYVEGVVGQPSLINPVVSDNVIDKDISSLIYSSLGKMATSVSQNENGRVYTVDIKKEAYWSDGQPITSDDVLFTVQTIQNPEVNSPMYSNWRGIVVEKITDKKVRFSLPSSYVFFENNIDRLLVIPEHLFGTIPQSNIRLSSYNLEPVSSGPYLFEDFQRRRDGFITRYDLEINESYHGNQPFIENFYFRFFESRSDLYQAYKQRDINGFGSLIPSDDLVYSLPNIVIETTPMPRYYSIFFNPKATSMLQDETFRRALDIAIDKDELVRNVLDSSGSVVVGPYGINTLDIRYSGPNKEEAERLIEELRNEEEEMSIEITVPSIDFLVRTAQFVKEEWEEVGIDEVIITPLQSSAFSELVLRERNYESLLFGNVMENNHDLFPFWHSSERFYPGLNLALYSNETVDEALDEIRNINDPSERKQLFTDTVNKIRETSPAAFLYTIPYTYIHNEELQGFSFDDKPLVVPSERFNNIEDWHVQSVRVIQ